MHLWLAYFFLVCFQIKALYSRPTVGIIRWDAWNQVNGQYDDITYYVHKVMSPQHWHFRLPFYAKELGANNVSFNGDNQAVMDQEIAYAKHAGIDYWAFDTYCAYGPNCETTDPLCKQYYVETSNKYCPQNPAYGLKLYLASERRKEVNFTLLLLGSPPCNPTAQEYYVSLMKSDSFQTVLDGRPLVYLFQFDDAEARACGGWSGAKAAYDHFRSLAIAAGLKNPYFVLMDFDINTLKSHAAALGFDAISTYALPGGSLQGTPFDQQVSAAQGWWRAAAENNGKVVPLAPTGWDPRPRAETPPPWVNEGPEHYLQPTAQQLQDYMKSAVQWTCANANAAEAQTILIYAWNESSENGGAIMPNLGNGTYYIDALSAVLPGKC